MQSDFLIRSTWLSAFGILVAGFFGCSSPSDAGSGHSAVGSDADDDGKLHKPTEPATGGSSTIEIDWDSATLRLRGDGSVAALIDKTTGVNHVTDGYHFVSLNTEDGNLIPRNVRRLEETVMFDFPLGATITFGVETGTGHSRWNLLEISGYDPARIHDLQMGTLRLAQDPEAGGRILNSRYIDGFAVAVMGTALNTRGLSPVNARADRDGVNHTFVRDTQVAREGGAAVYRARSRRSDDAGWANHTRPFHPAIDLSGLASLKLWVLGTGAVDDANQGAILKLQLTDGRGGYRVDVIDSSFDGWREVTLSNPSRNTVDLDHVTQMNFLYNAIRSGTEVESSIDEVRAVLSQEGGNSERMLESFDDEASGLWDGTLLTARAEQASGLTEGGFAIVAAPRANFDAAVEALSIARDLPMPAPGGVWNKRSPRTKRSYLFLPQLKQAEAAEAARWARRGGFDTVLIGRQWSDSHGHHRVDTNYFPDGLEGLKAAAKTLREAGLRVGLHVMAPAVFLDDPYVAPVPHPGLYTGATMALGATLSARDMFLPTAMPPRRFPKTDGGYQGQGSFVQIGEEIVQYESLSMEAPYGFVVKQRGALGTRRATHREGEPVRHLLRSYGYFLFDLNSDLAREVTQNFCKVANAIEADMVYLDGSEKLQGGSRQHWFDNARLHQLYYDCLNDPDTLIQASTYSHHSWHILARHATADNDGFSDVTEYYDTHVVPSFAGLHNDLMPVDAGWFYIFDTDVTVSETEYALQRALVHDASFSLQTNMKYLRTHPDMGLIFDLTCAYERIRLADSLDATLHETLLNQPRAYRLDLPPGAPGNSRCSIPTASSGNGRDAAPPPTFIPAN